MTRGQKVAGGDRLGKTIVFAKNNDHALFIADRFNKNYPLFKGEFARVITFKTEYAQTLIDSFSNPAKPPHIAPGAGAGVDIEKVQGCRGDTCFLHLLHPSARLAPFG